MTQITHPVALADQLDAAQLDADRAFRRITRNTGMRVSTHAPSDWFVERFTDLLFDIADGCIQRCPHLSAGPRPAFAAFWRDDRVVCGACMGQLTGPDHATTCDRCHAAPEFIAVHTVQIDTLMVFYALCERCDALDAAETDPDQSAGGE